MSSNPAALIWRTLCRFGSGIVLLFLGGVVILAGIWFLKGPDILERYEKPMTYDEAVKGKHLRFPFPKSAHHIQYALYGDWQAYDCRVRFEAPVQDCLDHMATVIAWNDQPYHRKSDYPRTEVTRVDPVGAGYLEEIPWFDVDAIHHGIALGKSASHTPRIWVDTDRGVFYFAESD